MKFEALKVQITNNSNDITMAAVCVLFGWKRSQINSQVAFREMCDALRKADMNSYVHDILIK